MQTMDLGRDENFFQSVSHLLSEAEITQLKRTGMGRSVGFGRKPALLIIDAQNYMIGATDPDDRTEYPSACASAAGCLPAISAMAAAFRAKELPVIYTRQVARLDGLDMGVKRIKRGVQQIEGWYLEGTRGSAISTAIAPAPQDIVLTKIKQSAFHGTPLINLLIDARVDTVVVVGGSTSNCIRATCIDASSHNYRVIVPHDAVFDRIRISHEVNLMDIARQLGDVVSSRVVLDALKSIEV